MNAACAIALDQESCQFRLYGMMFVLVECNETYLPGLPNIPLSSLSAVGKARLVAVEKLHAVSPLTSVGRFIRFAP